MGRTHWYSNESSRYDQVRQSEAMFGIDRFVVHGTLTVIML